MPTFLAPSVNVQEGDFSTIIPAVSTSITGVVGIYDWGPCNKVTSITSDGRFIEKFGTPDNTNYEHWFSAWNNLQYNNTLLVVRAADTTTFKNAGLNLFEALDGTAPTEKADYIGNSDLAEDYIPTFGSGVRAQVFAKYPSTTKGNKIKVAIANDTDFATANVTTGITFKSVFDYTPGDNEIAVAVLYPDDAGDYEVVEKYLLSTEEGTKDASGNNIYFEEYINRNSNYILMFDNTDSTDDFDSFEATLLSGGLSTASNVDTGDAQTGYDLFANPDELDVNIIIDGAWNDATTQGYIIDNIVEERKDCIAILGVPKASLGSVDAAITYRTTTLNKSTSYAALYAQYKYQLDKWNDVYRWVPITGDVAGVYAVTDEDRDPWFAPAGFSRGKIKNVSKFLLNPNKGDQKLLYKDGVNAVLFFPSEGPVVFGQKTLLNTPSSFDRVDVRRLFIIMEKAISTSAKYLLFEKNNTFTQNRFVGMVEPYLRDIQGREGITDFYIQADESVNTPEVVDRNEFIGVIWVKPSRTAEFILLQFNSVRTGVEFSEIVKTTA